MCNYCKIYSNKEELDKVAFDTEQKFYVDGGFVRNNGKIDLVLLDHDEYHNKVLEDVKFCPYCGRKLE